MVLNTRFSDALDKAQHAVSYPTSEPDFMQGFILSRRVMECSEATLHDYRSRLGQFSRFLSSAFLGLSLVDVKRQHIESYLMWLKENGRKSWTLKTSYRTLHAFYNWMLEEQFVKNSPLARIKPPKVPKISKPFITNEQRDHLLHLCPVTYFMGARTNAMIWILWTTGIRISELASLELSDLHWDKNRIRVFGKGRKERYVPFTKEAKRAVWRYLAYRKDNLSQLWLTEERTPMHVPSVREAINRTYERAGFKVKDVCHIFRRSWAMRNLKAGVPQKYVQLIGGWESVTTLEQYVRAMESEDALEANWV